jgi:hypothetical protein
LTEKEVFGPKKMTDRFSTDGANGSWLEIDEDSTSNIFTTSGFNIIGVNSLE